MIPIPILGSFGFEHGLTLEHMFARLDDMNGRIVALASQLAAADPATCDRVGLGELTRAVSQLRSFCDALDVRIARRADELAAEGRSEPAAGVLANNGRRAGGEARAAARRGETCERHPGFGEALGDGEISSGHVDVLGRARAGLDWRRRSRSTPSPTSCWTTPGASGWMSSPVAAPMLLAKRAPTRVWPVRSGCAASVRWAVRWIR